MDNIMFEYLNRVGRKNQLAYPIENYRVQYNGFRPFKRNNYGNFQQYPSINNMHQYHNIPSVDTFCKQEGYIKRLRKAPTLLRRRPIVRKMPPKKLPSKHSPTKSPPKSPSKSPPKSPPKSPSKSPPKSPTKSPSKSPTKSPPKSPTKSPPKNLPSTQPTVLRVRAVKPKFVRVKTPGVKNTMTFY